MANYECACRTNYFRVTNEDRYQKLYAKLRSDDLYDLSEVTQEGTIHCFASYGSIWFCPDGDEEEYGDMNDFYKAIQAILPEGEAFMLFESGHEKLRYVSGDAVCVTRDRIAYSPGLQNWALAVARELLDNPDYNTQMVY